MINLLKIIKMYLNPKYFAFGFIFGILFYGIIIYLIFNL